MEITNMEEAKKQAVTRLPVFTAGAAFLFFWGCARCILERSYQLSGASKATGLDGYECYCKLCI